jgi:hypothetical protein
MYEDQAFFFKLCLGAPIFVESGCWDRYRQHADSTCVVSYATGEYDPDGKPSPTTEAFLNWLEGYLVVQGIADRELWRALGAAFRPYRHPVLHQLRAVTRSLARVKDVPGQVLRALRRVLFSPSAHFPGYTADRSRRR